MRSGEGYTGKCPAHDDAHNSLSFGKSTSGKILLHCHAGCTIDSIAAALGMDKSMLLHGAPKGQKKRGGDASKKRKVLQPGTYLVRLVGVVEERGPANADGSPGLLTWKLRFVVASGEEKSQWVFDSIRFDERGLPRLKALAAAMGVDVSQSVDLQPPMLEGRTVNVTVENYEHDGLQRARVAWGGYAPAKEITYDYQDPAGAVLFQVVRLEPKAFYQRRPNGRGGWIYSLGDITRVPYRLPELLAEPSREAFVVEGEKDADRLRRSGLLATTSPQGAGKWKKIPEEVLAQAFAGRAVYVLPDNDKTGQQHAREVAASLSRIAEIVKVVDLPNLAAKGDVSDWLDLGGTPAALADLCAAAPTFTALAAASNGCDSGHVVTNFEVEEFEDEKGATKQEFSRIPLNRVLKAVLFATDGWPKRLGHDLFIDHDGEVVFLDGEDAVFSYIHSHAELRWQYRTDSANKNYVTRGELVSALCREAVAVDEVTTVPLEPLPPKVYVTTRFPKTTRTDESFFGQFLKFFRPAKPIDHALLCALALTPFWGGPPGGRPLIVLTGPEGIGAQETGKTSAAVFLTSLAGPFFSLRIDKASFADGVSKQLLSESAAQSRIVLIDNLTGITDSAELAEMITATTFHGRPSHGKQRQRSNLLTWVATAVAPQFTRDLASRSFVVHLATPDRQTAPRWSEDVAEFVTANRDRLVADALSILRGDRCEIVAKHSRFPHWDRQVLACNESANDVLRTKAEREQSIDSDEEDLALFLREVAKRYAMEASKELSPMEVTKIWNDANGTQYTARWVPRKLKEHMARGRIPKGVDLKWKTRRGSAWIFVPRDIIEAEAEENARSASYSETVSESRESHGDSGF